MSNEKVLLVAREGYAYRTNRRVRISASGDASPPAHFTTIWSEEQSLTEDRREKGLRFGEVLP